MNRKSLSLLGSLALGCSSLTAWAQQTPPEQPPATPPPAGEATTLVPVPGTDGALTTLNADTVDQVFTAGLSGAEEVPPRETESSGALALTLDPDGSTLHYRLSVENLDNVTAAHLHLGQDGVNGPIVVPLLGEGAQGDAATPPAGTANGVIAEGTIAAGQLTGPLAGTPPSVFTELLRSGAIYANVHTTQFPEGEIRGQVEGIGANTDAVELLEGMPGGIAAAPDDDAEAPQQPPGAEAPAPETPPVAGPPPAPEAPPAPETPPVAGPPPAPEAPPAPETPPVAGPPPAPEAPPAPEPPVMGEAPAPGSAPDPTAAPATPDPATASEPPLTTANGTELEDLPYL